MRPTYLRTRFLLVLLPLLSLLACDPSVTEVEATSIEVAPLYLSFDGTSEATLSVTANGSWTLTSDASWLKVSQSSGRGGSSTVRVTVDRSGLPAQQHAGRLKLSGSGRSVTVNVSMRFPHVTGTVVDPTDEIKPGSLPRADALQGASPSVSEAMPPDVVPGEYLVLLDDGMALALEASASGPVPLGARPHLTTLRAMGAGVARDHGLRLASDVLSSGLPVVKVHATEAEVERLRADGRVALVEPNRRWLLPQVEAVNAAHDFGLQWHYDHIDLGSAWALTQGDPDVVVAVIDGGFATRHPDLSANLLPGYHFERDDPDPEALDACVEHGTHVAGTVAATLNAAFGVSGAAPGVKVLPLSVGYETLDGATLVCALDSYAVISAVEYAAGESVAGLPPIAPVDVINMSLGGYGTNTTFEMAVRRAIDAGVSVVAAAGNDGFTNVVSIPAAFDGVVAVAATDSQGKRASYSNAGKAVDIAAPGGDKANGVLSLGWDLAQDEGTWLRMAGTSMATPHVSAVVALMRSMNPELDPASVTAILHASARDLGAPGRDDLYGWGMLDAGKAVEYARNSLGVTYRDVVVRLSQGGTLVAEAHAGVTGRFDLGPVPAGTYLLEAGTDLDGNGQISDPGERYASTTVAVAYAGDLAQDLQLSLR